MSEVPVVSEYPIDVTWRPGFLRHRWRLTHEGIDKEFALATPRLARVPRDSRNPDALSRLRRTVGDVFVEWLLGAAREPICIGLEAPRRYWSVPWELIVGELDVQRRRNVALVRRIDVSRSVRPSRFEGSLRTLLLYGASSDPHDPTSGNLDLAGEAATVAKTWSDLDFGTRLIVEKPQQHAATIDGLGELAREFRPHIVVFSGHGRPRTLRHGAGLLFADGAWVDPREFRRLITAPGWFPPFFAFWACDTAREDRPRPDQQAPEFAQELVNGGAVSLVAMQAPISDPAAIVLARRFFEFVASGAPVERAIAEVRSELMAAPPHGTHVRDWAAPVVWAATAGVPQVTWGADDGGLAQRQLVAWRLAAASLGAFADPVLVSEDARETAARLSTRRTWIRGEPSAMADRAAWADRLRAVQVDTALSVLAVDLERGDARESLAAWAERVYPTLLPGDLSHPIADLIRRLRRDPQRAWADAAAQPDLFIAVTLAGDLTGDSWFWDALNVPAGGPPCAVMSAQPPGIVDHEWNNEDIGAPPLGMNEIDEIIAESGRLVRVLVALNFPMNTAWVELPEYGGPRTPAELPGFNSLTVLTSRGRVVRSDVRHHVLAISSHEDLVQAHLDAAALLGRGEVELTTENRQRRLSHLLGGERFQDALLEASDLLLALRSLDQPRAILGSLRELDAHDSSLKLDLPAPGLLTIAWAFLKLGQPEVARYWLEQTAANDPILQAWKHSLLAEMWKSIGESGAKDFALAEVKEAVRICRLAISAGDGRPELAAAYRAHRQDQARIQQYLFGEREQAARTYRSLLSEWQGQPDSAMNVAIAKRNLAECIRTEAHGEAALEQAEALLTEAIAAAVSHPPSTALAELFYERAKTYSLQRRPDRERDDVESAIRVARESGHDMLVALAENRRFWRFSSFEARVWWRLASALEEFPDHGWAVRALVDGRLAAAHALSESGVLAGAIRELELAQAALERNPSFDRGKDRWRRAATAAGLELFGIPHAWKAFEGSAYWVRPWLSEHGEPDAPGVWSTWHGNGET